MSHAGAQGERGPKVCAEGKRLCVPVFARGPSGVRLRHAMDCPAHPLEPISVREYAKGRRSEWPRRGRIA